MGKKFSLPRQRLGSLPRRLVYGLVQWLVGTPEAAEVARLSDRARRDMGLDPP